MGGGPAGIFAALEFAAQSELRVLLLEKGADISERRCPARATGSCCSLLSLRHHHRLGRGGGLLRRQADPELRGGRLAGRVRGRRAHAGADRRRRRGSIAISGRRTGSTATTPEVSTAGRIWRRGRVCGWSARPCGTWAPSGRGQCWRPCGPSWRTRSRSSPTRRWRGS